MMRAVVEEAAEADPETEAAVGDVPEGVQGVSRRNFLVSYALYILLMYQVCYSTLNKKYSLTGTYK